MQEIIAVLTEGGLAWGVFLLFAYMILKLPAKIAEALQQGLEPIREEIAKFRESQERLPKEIKEELQDAE